MRELLVRYLLGELDSDEQSRLEKQLRDSPELQRELAYLQKCFAETNDVDIPVGEPPRGLAKRTAKAALLGMTRSAAKELAPYNIIVNATAPCAATPMTETVRTDERFSTTYLDKIPLGRWAEPEEIAGTYVFLASADASYLTGQVIPIDGGMVMAR